MLPSAGVDAKRPARAAVPDDGGLAGSRRGGTLPASAALDARFRSPDRAHLGSRLRDSNRAAGIGWDPPAARLIEGKLAPLLSGRDAFAAADCWEAMVRAVRNLGAAALCSMAISAVDSALWDLKGKLLDAPVVIEHMLFDGALSPVEGEIEPDLGRAGLGLELKDADTQRFAV